MTGDAYSHLAGLYDRLSGHDYAAWAAYLSTLLQQNGVRRGGRVYDAACGSGALTLRLYRKGYRITAADLSEEMLACAVQTARAAGAQIPFLHADMRALRTTAPQDAVLASCDAVNYLHTPQDLQAFFGAAHRALRSGGVLLFDISTAEKLRAMDGQIYADEWDDGLYVWNNAYSREEETLQMQLSFFLRREDGLYRRLDETHLQHLWPRETIAAHLQQAGFTVTCYDALSQAAPHEQSARIHFLAIKA